MDFNQSVTRDFDMTLLIQGVGCGDAQSNDIHLGIRVIRRTMKGMVVPWLPALFVLRIARYAWLMVGSIYIYIYPIYIYIYIYIYTWYISNAGTVGVHRVWKQWYPLIARFMGPTWGPSGADRTQVGPMLAPWILLSGSIANRIMKSQSFIANHPLQIHTLLLRIYI